MASRETFRLHFMHAQTTPEEISIILPEGACNVIAPHNRTATGKVVKSVSLAKRTKSYQENEKKNVPWRATNTTQRTFRDASNAPK